MRLIWSLVEQSLSEADFLWTQLDQFFDTHPHSFADVEARVEPRLLGALDGIRVAGTSAIEPLLQPSIRDTEPGVASVAAYVLSLLSDPAADRAIEQAVREVSGYHADAYARGLGRAAQLPALHALWGRLNDASASARAVVLEALSFCGQAPEADWKSLLDDASPQLRAAAASALRFASPASIERYVHVACDISDTEARNRALVAGVAAGSSSAWRRCLHHIKTPDRWSGPLLLLAALLGSARELSLVLEARRQPELSRDAVWALGFAGTVPALEACLDQMRASEHVRVAAEAVCAITGLDLQGQRLKAASYEVEEDADRSLEEDDLTANLVLGGDELLPVPDVPGVEQWWDQHRGAYASDRRYLGGQLRTLGSLQSALQHGPTRRRAAIALELSARSAGACALQPLAFCRHQRQQLDQFATLHPNALRNAARVLGIATLSDP